MRATSRTNPLLLPGTRVVAGGAPPSWGGSPCERAVRRVPHRGGLGVEGGAGGDGSQPSSARRWRGPHPGWRRGGRPTLQGPQRQGRSWLPGGRRRWGHLRGRTPSRTRGWWRWGRAAPGDQSGRVRREAFRRVRRREEARRWGWRRCGAVPRWRWGRPSRSRRRGGRFRGRERRSRAGGSEQRGRGGRSREAVEERAGRGRRRRWACPGRRAARVVVAVSVRLLLAVG